MRKLGFSLIAACSIMVAAAALPARAMTATTAAGLKSAVVDSSAATPVVYICKQRYWSGRRYCYWRPGGYRWHWRWRWPRWWR